MDTTHIQHIEAANLRLGYSNIKGFQLQAVDALLEGKHVFLSQQTGMGKSAVYQLLTLAVDSKLQSLENRVNSGK